jgi:hypothetical protein
MEIKPALTGLDLVDLGWTMKHYSTPSCRKRRTKLLISGSGKNREERKDFHVGRFEWPVMCCVHDAARPYWPLAGRQRVVND